MLFHQLQSSVRVVTGPAVEPVSVDDITLHVRGDTDADTPRLESFIRAAREMLESDTRRAFCQQTFLLVMDRFPSLSLCGEWAGVEAYRANIGSVNVGQEIELWRCPVQSVSSIQYYDVEGTLQTLSAANYIVDTYSRPARITPTYGTIWPITQPRANAVQVTFVAGETSDSAIPELARQAIRMLVAHWYCNSAAVGTVTGETEFAYTACARRLRYCIE